jgi:hypothetical protein
MIQYEYRDGPEGVVVGENVVAGGARSSFLRFRAALSLGQGLEKSAR